MKSSSWITFSIVFPAVVLSGDSFGQGDYYIRSQFDDGSFTGSHEILASPKTGYHELQYCDQTFWVSTTTVAWTEEEVAAGRVLILEEDTGNNRTVVCADSTAFARLDDLGLDEREIERLRSREAPFETRENRLHTIRDAFKQFK